jgi:carbon-monoxide dehydrogenase large subunit
MRDNLAQMLGVESAAVRVDFTDVGGAFGARTAPYYEFAVLLHAARLAGRPVKWVSTRAEDFLNDGHGRGIRLTGELALDGDGRFLAIRTAWLADSGAYLTQAGALTNSMNGKTMAAGPYRVAAFYGHHRQVMTNATPTEAYRGAGRPEAAYVIERLVDEAAATLGIDRLELRRRNVIPRAAFPYTSATGTVFDSADFAGMIDAVAHASGWKEVPGRRADAARRGRLRGLGCALFIEPSGGGATPKDQVAVQFCKTGEVRLFMAAGASGQGHETVFPQLIGEWLGIDAARVVLHAGDPDGPALIGGASIGSRTALAQGSAFRARRSRTSVFATAAMSFRAPTAALPSLS